MNPRLFALGLNFKSDDEARINEHICDIFNTLNLRDLRGLSLFGKRLEGSYIFIFANGKLGHMRRLYKKLTENTSLVQKLDEQRPYLLSNAILKLEDKQYYGRILPDCSIERGEIDIGLDRAIQK